MLLLSSSSQQQQQQQQQQLQNTDATDNRQETNPALPYGGDIQQAMAAKDRAAIRAIMRARPSDQDRSKFENRGKERARGRGRERVGPEKVQTCFVTEPGRREKRRSQYLAIIGRGMSA